jgi:FkbM family methyltransferase
MTARGLDLLGSLAHALRALRMSGILDAATAGVDRITMALGTPPLWAEVGGIRLRGFSRHRSFLAHLASETYEPYTLELFRSAICPGSLVIDGGAHIGLFSLVACATLTGEGFVIAIEADPYNFRALELNLRRSGCGQVQAFRAAVWREPGERDFFVNRGTTGSSLIIRPNLGSVEAIRTPTVSLDDVTRDRPPSPLVVKLDLEGAEIEALQGMGELLARSQPAQLLVEVNPGAQAEAGHSDTALIRTLRGMGLRVAFVDEEGRRLVDIGEHAPRKGMLYCTRGVA